MANAGEERSSRENGPAIYETFEKGVKNDAELTTTILGTTVSRRRRRRRMVIERHATSRLSVSQLRTTVFHQRETKLRG